ncbi:MAG: nitrous oxide reductase family maturation protein NosD [Reichenbachiella sp.]|uniref:nitrous oxide reductase family maturation protein NosD n=1 Tax=Reichenbachiella sp. TaxID=2184521 RepID=UPI003263862C
MTRMMCRLIIRIFFLLLISGSFSTQNVLGSELKVCKNCPINDVAAAVKQAVSGDTIRLASGTYTAVDVVISKPLTLLSTDNAVLDGQLEKHILNIQSDSVSIIGLTFINAGRSFTKDYAAIYAHKINHFSLEKNRVIQPYFGFLIEKSHFGKIKDNTISGKTNTETDSGNGIHLWHCSEIEISGNETYGLRDGIYFEFVSNSQVINNRSHHNVRYGLHFMFSNHDEYRDNTFHDNGAGVAVMFSKFIVMKNNTFSKNWGTASYGLLLKEIYDAEVIENHFEENTIAIFLEGTGRINYQRNQFYSNGWGVKVSGGCYTNIFVDNNFINNALDIAYNSKMNDNEFRHNYWSSYTGYDLDRDGVGDVPYRPVKLFSYIISQTPESIVLLRSLFVDIINFSEKVSPIFTPDNLMDNAPAMEPIL